ncbi:MAG TPA: DUF2130 domain-containing protein, partial [Phycisphaerae bacterium]
MKERIANHERAQAAAITARLQEQFAREKAEALDRERQMAAVREASARDDGRQAAEAAAQEKMAVAERVSKDAQAAIHARADQAEAAKTAAELVSTNLRADLDQMRRDGEAAIEKVKHEAANKEADIRAEARQVAEGAVQEKLAALETRIEQADVAKAAAEGARNALQTQMEQMRRDNDAAIEKLNQDAATRENAARQEVASQAEAAMREKITQAEQAKAEAEAKVAAAEQREHKLQEAYDAQLAQRLQEQREALEQAKADAVNAEKSAAFEVKLKLSNKVEELQRTIDRKTAEELGEGAEIDLFEDLKSEFEGDRIERINRGQPGADIRHVVIHHGKECGKIIYDSKNHNAWRNEFVTKLASDQMAEKAEHAMLATRKFPSGARQLHLQDGVIIVSPSRVLALVQIVRQHLVQTHALRLSNEARAQKTAALYSFITSERSVDLFGRIDTHAEALLDLQAKEMKAHDVTWKRQGELIRSVQKV